MALKRKRLPATETLGLLTRPAASNGRASKIVAKHANLALVQFAPRKGDVGANAAQVRDAFEALKRDRAPFPDVVVFPETALSGYFVEGAVGEVAMTARQALDLLRRSAAAALGKSHKPFDAIIGFYEEDAGTMYNSALYARLGKTPSIVHVHRKLFLPTYGVFDEERFVSRGHAIEAFDTAYGRAAILICEDACHSIAVTITALRGAEIIFVPSASPGRGLERVEPANVRMWREICEVSAAEHGLFIAYAGLLGFEGGKGFTGSSRLVGPRGDLRAEAPFDTPAILRADAAMTEVIAARAALPMLGDLESNLPELVDALETELQRRPRRRPRRAKRRS